MEYQPKIKPESGSSDNRNLEDMNIHELVSVLRTAYKTEDFDRVEDVLVNKYKTLQTDILHLQDKFERGKRAQNNYERLLKEVKKNTSLTDGNINGDQDLRRKKNNALELEVLESDKKIVKSSELEKSTKKNSEPTSKGSKDALGPSSSSPPGGASNSHRLPIAVFMRKRFVEARKALVKLYVGKCFGK